MRKAILAFGLILPVLFTALFLFSKVSWGQINFSEITLRLGEVENAFNSLTAFIEKNPQAEQEILSQLNNYLKVKNALDKFINNLSDENLDQAFRIVNNLRQNNLKQIDKIQDLLDNAFLSEKVLSSLLKISGGLASQNEVLEEWIKDQQNNNAITPRLLQQGGKDDVYLSGSIVIDLDTPPKPTPAGNIVLNFAEGTPEPVPGGSIVLDLAATEKRGGFFQNLWDNISGIFQPFLPPISKAWVDQTRVALPEREVLFHIEFKNDLPKLPPQNDFVIGYFIDSDNDPKTGVFIPGRQYLRTPEPGSEDVGVDLFVGVKGKNKIWQPTPFVKDFKINKNLIIFTVDLNNFAVEFPWVAISSKTETTHTRAPEIGRGYFLITELQDRDVR